MSVLPVLPLDPERDPSGVVHSIAASPGDAVLVHRRRTLRSAFGGFARGPRAGFAQLVSWIVCVRIQAATRSRWNHVAGVVNHLTLVEAEWGGVRQISASYYIGRPHMFELRVVNAPTRVDRSAAVAYMNARVGKASYDWRRIILLRMATILFGPRGTRIVRNRRDGSVICSDLVAEAWSAGGFGRPWSLSVPADFSRPFDVSAR